LGLGLVWGLGYGVWGRGRARVRGGARVRRRGRVRGRGAMGFGSGC
jgi:hypothetical protein